MLFSLLTDANASSSVQTPANPTGQWILMGILLVIIIVFMVFSRRSQKKRQEETQKTLDAVKPGNKVKTIGGICVVVVEVCNDDNTFVLETGSDKKGKSYIKFDKQAIYQTDAKTEETPAVKEEKSETPAPAEEVFEEVKQESEETVETKAEE